MNTFHMPYAISDIISIFQKERLKIWKVNDLFKITQVENGEAGIQSGV